MIPRLIGYIAMFAIEATALVTVLFLGYAIAMLALWFAAREFKSLFRGHP